MQTRWLVAAAVGALGLGSAARSAQASELELAGQLWTDLGPSLSPMLSLGARPGTVKPGFQLRIGTLAGLPFQIEAGVQITPKADLDESTAVHGSIGLRLLPFGWKADGQRSWGGGTGNNLGFLLGYSTTGAYGGLAYEMMANENVGFVMELVTPLGGANPTGLPRMVTLNLGAKFQLPTFSGPEPEAPPPAGVTFEGKPTPSSEPTPEVPKPPAATDAPPSTPEERRDAAEDELDELAPTPDAEHDELDPTPEERRDAAEAELDELAPTPEAARLDEAPPVTQPEMRPPEPVAPPVEVAPAPAPKPVEGPPPTSPAERKQDAEKELEQEAPLPAAERLETAPAATTEDRKDDAEDELDAEGPAPAPKELTTPPAGTTEERKENAEQELERSAK